MIAAFSTDLRFLVFNRAYHQEFLRAYGYDIQVGTDFREAIASVPEDLAISLPIAARALQGESFTIEQEYGDPRRQRKFYELTCNALRDASGKQIGVMNIMRDVTRRREAEAKLTRLNEELEQQVQQRTAELESALREVQDHQRQLGAIIANMRESVTILDAERNILSMNQSAIELHGFSNDAQLPSSIAEYATLFELRDPDEHVLPPHDWPSARAARGEKVVGVELHIRRLDTGKRWVGLCSSVPIYDPQGKIQLIILTVLDITNRYAAEQTLRTERELLQTLFDTIPVMLTIYEPNTDVLRVNSEFERLIGWSNDELANINLMEKCYPDPAYREMVRQYMHETQPGWRDLLVTTRSGRRLESSWANIRLSDGRRVGIGIDVSQQRSMEREVLESEKRLRRAIEGTGVPLLAHVEDGTILAVSNGLLQATGFRREDLPTFNDWLQLAFGDRAAEMTDITRKNFRDDAVVEEVELPVRVGTGELRTWVFHAASPEQLADGRKFYLLIANDITQRKAAEEALRHSEAALRERVAQLRALYASAPVGLSMVDTQLRYLNINDKLAEFNGLPAEAHLGRTVGEMLPTLLADQVEAHCRRVLETGQPVLSADIAGPAAAPPHEIRYWLASYYPVRDDHGELLGVSMVRQDITERKLWEQALLESEQRFRQLAEAMPQIVWVAAPDGQNEYVNQKWEEYTGQSNEGAKGIDWQKNVHPDDVPAVHEAYQGFARQDYYEVEYRLRRRDGQYRWFVSRGLPIRDSQGNVTRWFGTCTDIHQSKQAVQNLRESQRRLQELNVTLERRVAARTATLERQTSQLRMLANELTEAEQRERKNLAQMLHDGLQQMLIAIKMRVVMCHEVSVDNALQTNLAEIAAILDKTIQASRSLAIELSPPILYDSDLPEALEWLARWFAKNHNFQVEVDTLLPLPEVVEPAKVFIFHAVRELLLNAVKHAQVGQARVRLQGESATDVRVEVIDAGRGFEPAPFDSDHSEPRGFGLLSIRERVEALGGGLSVYSTPGLGTRIALTVPCTGERGRLDQEQEAAAELPDLTASLDGAPCREVRVLVVDDHKIVREGLVMMLQLQPNLLVVGEAADGREAIERAAQLRPDVVVMDVNMPVMGGIEATRQIKQQYPDIQVIGLSLHQEEDMATAMREAGAAAYLQKDGPAQQLFDTILELCPVKA